MSGIQISDIKYFVEENYIDEIDGKKLESAVKLQELVKEKIKESNEGMKNNDFVSAKHNYWQTLFQELQSLVEESEK